MNPILKVLLVTSLVCFGLYLGASEFLGTTDKMKGSLDVNSLAHIRDEDPGEDPRPDRELDSVAAQRNSVQNAPERDQGLRIDVTTVKTSRTAIETDSNAEVDQGSIRESGTQTAGLDTSADKAYRLKTVLGITEPPPPVRAVDVVLEIPLECDANAVLLAPLPVKYRHESPAMKGASLAELKLLIDEYRHCEDGIFHLSHNPLGKQDATPVLMQRRLDELKYYFLQHSVPKAALRFPETHD